MAKAITKDTIVKEVLDRDSGPAALLEQLGMRCRTCPAAARETLEQACRLHKQDCGALVKNLNAYFLFRP